LGVEANIILLLSIKLCVKNKVLQWKKYILLPNLIFQSLIFIPEKMKKAKLFFNFLSAADMMFSLVAVLFTHKVVATPFTAKVPFSPRR
jgi:hypothetical protein